MCVHIIIQLHTQKMQIEDTVLTRILTKPIYAFLRFSDTDFFQGRWLYLSWADPVFHCPDYFGTHYRHVLSGLNFFRERFAVHKRHPLLLLLSLLYGICAVW